MTLLIAPMVSANPFTDLWEFLFGSSEEQLDSSRIIDDYTEEICTKRECTWTQHKAKVFDEGKTFNEMIESVDYSDGLITYNFKKNRFN